MASTNATIKRLCNILPISSFNSCPVEIRIYFKCANKPKLNKSRMTSTFNCCNLFLSAFCYDSPKPLLNHLRITARKVFIPQLTTFREGSLLKTDNVRALDQVSITEISKIDTRKQQFIFILEGEFRRMKPKSENVATLLAYLNGEVNNLQRYKNWHFVWTLEIKVALTLI